MKAVIAPIDVYPKLGFVPHRAEGCLLYDSEGQSYLDLYGGHAVISIGHAHPVHVERIRSQLERLPYYSNAVEIPGQFELAERLTKLSELTEYGLFLCNSGGEANENALKVASLTTGRRGIIGFRKGFHGRMTAALSVTDAPGLASPLERSLDARVFDPTDRDGIAATLEQETVAAVIFEAVQGVGGLDVLETGFLEWLAERCRATGTLLIADEVQSGFGRTGRFFAYQFSEIRPDLVTMAKGMGNGFPVGGVLIDRRIPVSKGMLGSTFGGAHLACQSVIAVLEVLEREALLANAVALEARFRASCAQRLPQLRIKGRGLMIGLDLGRPCSSVRKKLIEDHRIITGASSDPNVLRILPPLNVTGAELEFFLEALHQILES